MQKVGISISGGATKISGLYGAVEVIMLDYGIKPDYISGISAGAILSLPLALGKHDVIRQEVLNFTLDTFFSQKPVNEKGAITLRAAWNVLRGRNYLGRMDNLRDVLKKHVCYNEFMLYKKDKTLAEIVVMAVDMKTGKRHFKKLRDCGYDEAMDWIIASSSIPGYVNPVYKDDMMLYDGGLRDHNIGYHLMGNYEMGSHYSVYSRPEDIKEHLLAENKEYGNITQVLSRTMDILLAELSRNDQIKQTEYANKKGINNVNIFMPKVMQSQYDVDKTRLNQLYQSARSQAIETMEKTK